MRATPMLTPNPGTGNVLPTPQVKSNYVKQEVDLKPAGNTVALRTISDNPFEGGQKVTVVTQASGGMAPAPRSMTSQGVLHSMLPGLGETSTTEVSKSPSGGQITSQLISAASDAFTGREERKISEAQAQAAQADSQARQAEADAAIARANADAAMAKVRGVVDATSVNVGGMRVNLPLILLGGGLLAAALVMRNKGKKK